MQKGKRNLDVIWNVLIAVWTPVSLRKLNWPAVMSPYSKLSDLLHLTLISQVPDWALCCRQACSLPLTSGSVGSYGSDAEPFEMYASEDRDAVFEIQVITVAERADREELSAVMFLLFASLVFTQLHLGVQCSATEIPPLPALVVSSRKHFFSYSDRLFRCLLASPCTDASLPSSLNFFVCLLFLMDPPPLLHYAGL